MKKHTTHFKNKIKEFGRQLDSKITYELNGELIELGNEKLNSITPTFQSKILKSAMKQLDIDSNEDIPLNTEINYKFGTLIDDEYEYIDYGNYIVYSSEKQEDTDSYKIICYDKMLYSMVNYEGLRNGSFPMTVKEFLQNICKDLYIDFKDSEFANQDRIIEIDLYKDLGYTYRDVLDELSEVTASTICMNDNDELEVRYIEYASYDNEVTGETITINDNELDKAKSLIISGNLETKLILPSEYQQVEYIETTSYDYNSNYIDTGIKPTNNTSIELKAQGVFHSYDRWFGSSNLFRMEVSPSGEGQFHWNNNYKMSSVIVARHVKIKLDKNKLYVDDILEQTYQTGTFTDTNNLRLFSESTGDRDGSARIFYAKIWENDVLKRNFVPCYRKSDNVIGMYDLVENKFYINQGNIPFLKGNNVSVITPDYPQEIDVVEGVRNLVNKDNYISQKLISGVEFDINQDGTISAKGIASSNIFYDFYIENIQKGQYSFRGCPSGGNTSLSYGIRIFHRDDSGVTIYGDDNGEGITFENKINQNLTFEIIIRKNQTVNLIFKPILIKGMSIPKEYIPYGTNYLINKINGKNLLNINGKTSSNGIISIYEKGMIDFSGIATNTWSDFTKTQDLFLKADNYTFSKETNFEYNITIRCYYKDNTFNEIVLTKDEKSKSFNFIKDIVKYRFYISGFNAGTVIPQTTIKWQFEQGTQATEYEPYKQTIINYDLQNNCLAKIGDNIDTLDEVSGILNRKIGKIVLDGTENWNWWDITTNKYVGFYLYNTDLKIPSAENKYNYRLISNYFVEAETHSIIKNGQQEAIKQCGDYGLQYIAISIKKDRLNTIDINGFKQWLKQQYDNGTPVIIYYQLETPQTIQLTPTQIPLFEGTNNLSLEYNMPTEMTLKYTNEIDAIDEEYLKDVNINFSEKYGPINSIVLSRAAESDNVYIQDEESIEKNGLHELKIVDNQIMNFNDRSDYLPELLERLDGLEYYLNDFSSTGICYYDICDKYRIKVFDNTYECVMFNDEVNITQGLEENIYTDMPEETETDYTKADKTDQRINQTYLIVDKQNQKIESLASQVIDLTREKNGIRYLEINDAYPSDIITLKIKGKINSSSNLKLIIGTKLPRGELYPSNDLFPSNSLHFDYDGTLVKLPISQLNEDETLIIDNNDCYIEKDDGTITHYGEVHIPLNENDNYIYLQDFYNSPIDYYGKYAIKSEYTTVFTTKLEVDSTIQQTTDAIKLEVSKKADAGDIISIINQTADKIDIKGNRIEIQSEYFHLNDDGTIKSTGGEIGGLQITTDALDIETSGLYNYNRFDQLMVAMSIQNRISIDNYMTKILDVDNNNQITATDYVIISNIINKGRINDKVVSGKFEINSNNPKEFVTVLDEDGNVVSSMGVNGINSNYITCNNFVCGYAAERYTDTIGISMNGQTGNVTCQSLTQTSLANKKKNFELLSDALNIVNSTDIYKYNFKNENDDDKKHIGFVIGEDFRYNEDITSINNDGAEIYSMVSVLWKAVQEQQDIIEDIIEDMQKQIDELKEMINSGIH